MNKNKLEKILKKTKELKKAMLTTFSAEGELISRPMEVLFKEGHDDKIYFISGLISAKTLEIEDIPQVNISQQDLDDDTYISLSGEARIILDKKEIEPHWNLKAELWNPDGLENETVCLIEVNLTKLELWENNMSKVTELLEFGSAMMKRRKPEITQNTSVSLN